MDDVAMSEEQTTQCSSDVEEMKGVESAPSADNSVVDAEEAEENQYFSGENNGYGDYGDFDYYDDTNEEMEIVEEPKNDERSIGNKDKPYVVDLKATSKNEDHTLKTSQKLFAISRKKKSQETLMMKL